MEQRPAGQDRPRLVSALGLGLHGHVRHLRTVRPRRESIATIHASLEAGINLLDTGDFYGMGHNEMLIARGAEAAASATEALISVKFGGMRGSVGQVRIGFDTRPSVAMKNFAAYSLKRLGTDHIDIYRPAAARPERADRGDDRRHRRADRRSRPCRHIGLSEVGAETMRARGRRPPDRRPADRIFADLARHRGRRSCPPAANSASASPPMACCRAA